MLIKADGFELEIMEDGFVCLEKGETSHFCEWSLLDENLQETFKAFEKDLSKILRNFLVSDQTRRFLALSEKYEDAPKDPVCTIE